MKKTQEGFKATMKSTALTRTAEEYASRNSIHGIGYVFDRDLNLVDRLLWLLVVLALLLTAAIFSLNFWSQWRDEQVIKGHRHMILFAIISIFLSFTLMLSFSCVLYISQRDH